MKATVEELVSFGTRHTLSSQTDPKRGIGASLRLDRGAIRKRSACRPVRPCDMVTGTRVPDSDSRSATWSASSAAPSGPTTSSSSTGHIDSRVTDVMNATADAPGANDDGSGTAAVMEAARVLSKHKFPGTIVYAALTGEEQGLYGGKMLADYAKAQGWNVIANLEQRHHRQQLRVGRGVRRQESRVFSEGPRWQGHEELAAQHAQPRRRE